MRRSAAEWVWVPPEASQVLTSEYQPIGYPGYFLQPTQVAWTVSARPARQVVDEVLAHVAGWHRDTVWWWIREDSRPASLEAELLADTSGPILRRAGFCGYGEERVYRLACPAH